MKKLACDGELFNAIRYDHIDYYINRIDEVASFRENIPTSNVVQSQAYSR